MTYREMLQKIELPETEHNLFTLGQYVLDNQGERARLNPDATPLFEDDEQEEGFWASEWEYEATRSSMGWDTEE